MAQVEHRAVGLARRVEPVGEAVVACRSSTVKPTPESRTLPVSLPKRSRARTVSVFSEPAVASSGVPECSSSHEGTWMGPGSQVTARGEPLTCASPIVTESLCTPASSHWYPMRYVPSPRSFIVAESAPTAETRTRSPPRIERGF